MARTLKAAKPVKLSNRDDFYNQPGNVDAKGGNDSLLAWGGSTLTGGKGADTFSFIPPTVGTTVITDFNRAEGDTINVSSSRIGRIENLGWLLIDDEFSPAARANHDAGQIVQAANGDGTYTLSFYRSNADIPAFKIIINVKVIPSDFSGGENWVRYPANPTEGPDSFVGFHGDDRIDLSGGDDTYDGLSGNDQIFGGAGNDTLRAGDPIGTVIGGSRLDGGSGDDLLIAGSGQDILDGGDGADRLMGGGSTDQLLGGDGDDTLAGGVGGDHLTGGSGADTYLYSDLRDSPDRGSYRYDGYHLSVYDSPDTIVGFDPLSGDIIDLRQLDIDPETAGVQTVEWTFAGSEYDHELGGAQMTLKAGTIGIFTPDGLSYGDPGTILSLYLDDGDAEADFEIQLVGSHLTPIGILGLFP